MLHQHMLGPSTSLNNANANSALQSSVLSDGVLLSHSQPTREELKKTFETREGVYRSVANAEFSRPRPLPQYHMPAGIASAAASQMAAAGSPVRVSFLNLARKSSETANVAVEAQKKEQNEPATRYEQETDDRCTDKICFNVGKELYVYSYRGTQTETDLSRPLDKRVYKGTSPTCHSFNQETANFKSCQLAVGFTLGQLQIIDPFEKTVTSPVSRLYNEDRFIEKTAVTCIRWLPSDPHFFLASYVSGNLYVYDERIPPVNNNNSSAQGPPWSLYKDGDKFSIYTWKSKHQKNPIWRWQIGDGGAIHQFNFSSSDGKLMATVGHDGFLRIFNYQKMEIVALMKSYFGGLLTLSWSPDGKLIATGGEDDLLTVYSVSEKRVVCRGQAHKSWVSQVQFDPYLCTTEEDLLDAANLLDDVTMRSGAHELNAGMHATSTYSRCSLASFNTIAGGPAANSVCYRIGSVGHDTLLCFWDITEDMLIQANVRRHRNSTIIAPMAMLEIQTSPMAGARLEDLQEVSPGGGIGATPSEVTSSSTPPASTPPPLLPPPPQPPRQEKTKKKRFTKKAFTLARFSSGSNGNGANASQKATSLINGASNGSDGTKRHNPALTSQISCCNETRLLGSKYCPGIRDVPMIEPLMVKKVSHDRLTVLEFREDCVVTACQEGFICTWGRPGRWQEPPRRECLNSPGTASPETGHKTQQQQYGGEATNGVTPSRSSSSYSNHEQQVRSPNATSPLYRVSAGNTSAYHRPGYTWQNAN